MQCKFTTDEKDDSEKIQGLYCLKDTSDDNFIVCVNNKNDGFYSDDIDGDIKAIIIADENVDFIGFIMTYNPELFLRQFKPWTGTITINNN